MYQVLNCLGYEHDLRLVVLGGAVCVLASAVAISLFTAPGPRGAGRGGLARPRCGRGGCGIWATHFIAMLAYDPGRGRYNLGHLIVSGPRGCDYRRRPRIALARLSAAAVALGGAVVGGGVAAMHYTGMMALEIPGRIMWSPASCGLRRARLCVRGACALVAARARLQATLAAAVLLTLAIVSHHFTAMGAVTPVARSDARDRRAVDVARDSFLSDRGRGGHILGMSLVAALIDRQSSSELRQQKVLLDTALENMSQGLCMFDADGRIMLFNERYGEMMGRTGSAQRPFAARRSEYRRRRTWDGDPEEFFGIVMAAAQRQDPDPGHHPHGRAIRVVDQPMKGGGWVATFEDITEWQAARSRSSHGAP